MNRILLGMGLGASLLLATGRGVTPPNAVPPSASPNQPPTEIRERGRGVENVPHRHEGEAIGQPSDRDPRFQRLRESMGERIKDREGRQFSPEKIKAFLEVVNDLNPKWAEEWRTKFKDNPEGMRKALARMAPRFMMLVALREQNEELYKVRISEFKMQDEFRHLCKQIKAAQDQKNETLAGELTTRIKKLATMLVDISLKAQSLELFEMDRQVQELRKQLEQRAKPDNRTAMIDRMVHDAISGQLNDPASTLNVRSLPIGDSTAPGQADESASPDAPEAGDNNKDAADDVAPTSVPGSSSANP